MTGPALASEAAVVTRLLEHIDAGTTDLGTRSWREPVANYRSADRFAAERRAMRRLPLALCPSAALPKAGSWLARESAGTPLLAVRGDDGRVRVFRNACRHRGTQLASGSGCQRAFTCPYHGWTYGLDGSLRHVPHAHGFPDLKPDERGLVPVACEESQGVVFACQEPGVAGETGLGALPTLVPEGHHLLDARETETAVNWKLIVEGFLEGYHIKSTHPSTFYPLQYDNVNVVERFGRNHRIAFPYRSIEREREVAEPERTADGKLTFVTHLFPQALVATFPGRLVLAILEPCEVGFTRQVAYAFSAEDPGDAQAGDLIAQGRELVDAGSAEDIAMAQAIQRGLASGANESFEFGLFESAIVSFHETLHALIDEGASG